VRGARGPLRGTPRRGLRTSRPGFSRPTSVTHPLAPLLGPLRFASQRDFAALGTVKGLQRVLSAALEAAEQAGVPAAALAPLRAELPVIDHRSLPLRRASVRRVIGALPATGLVLPPEL